MKFMRVPADFRANQARFTQLTQVTHVATEYRRAFHPAASLNHASKRQGADIGKQKNLQGAWAQLGLEL